MWDALGVFVDFSWCLRRIHCLSFIFGKHLFLVIMNSIIALNSMDEVCDFIGTLVFLKCSFDSRNCTYAIIHLRYCFKWLKCNFTLVSIDFGG